MNSYAPTRVPEIQRSGQLLGYERFATAYYHCDGNGNITAMVSTNGAIVARCGYDPYGNVLSMSGSIAAANLYRFASKEHHPNSGLAYYLYRFYSPSLQRWLNRDPLGDIASLPVMTADISPRAV